LLDFQPTITALADGRALAVWTHATAVTDPIVPDPTSLLESFELRYAIFDPATDSWSTPMILAVAGMDFLPQIVPHEGTAELVYFHDPDGSTFLFPQDVATVDHQLFSRTFDGAIWSNPVLLLDDVASHVAPQVLVGALGDGIDAIAVTTNGLPGSPITKTRSSKRSTEQSPESYNRTRITGPPRLPCVTRGGTPGFGFCGNLRVHRQKPRTSRTSRNRRRHTARHAGPFRGSES
jgi:hypothetical protein